MKHLLSLASVALTALTLQGCVVARTPAISSSVIEADAEKGNLLNITGENCGGVCSTMAMNKAQEACPNGYVIHQTTPAMPFNYIQMTIRCQKGK